MDGRNEKQKTAIKTRKRIFIQTGLMMTK